MLIYTGVFFVLFSQQISWCAHTHRRQGRWEKGEVEGEREGRGLSFALTPLKKSSPDLLNLATDKSINFTLFKGDFTKETKMKTNMY